MKEVFSKTGYRLVGRTFELYTGDCPPERPCTEKQVEDFRKVMDVTQPPEGGKRPDPPTPLERVKSFAKALLAEAAFRATGGASPTDLERQERLTICRSDKCGVYNPDGGICNACGCYLEAGLIPPRPMGKVDCATQRCPRGLWEFTGGYEGKSCCQEKKKAVE